MNYRKSYILASACACALATSAANAQQSSSVLEEIVVTAQKRSENLQEVPIAITAITSDTRQTLGINTIEDMTNFVPGLTYEGQLDRTSIRGVGRVVNAPGTDPGVGLYVDGVYNSSTTIAGRSSIFTDRIEVLRGPQGSLFGRNTTGGAISMVSRGAKDSFGAEVQVTYGSYDRKVVDTTVTGPITDWLRFRVTGALTKQDDGYFTNYAPAGPRSEGGVVDNKDAEIVFDMDLGETVDLTLRYTLRDTDQLDRFSANFGQPNYNTRAFFGLIGTTALSCSATTFSTRGSCVPSALYNATFATANTPTTPPTPPAPVITGVIPASQVFTLANPASPTNRRAFIANVPTSRGIDSYDAYSPTLIWHMPFLQADIKWIGGYTEYTYHSWTDFDTTAREFYDYQPVQNTGTPATPNYVATSAGQVRIYTGQNLIFNEDKSYYSNDLQLVSTSDGDIKYVFGLYQYHEDYEQTPILQGFANPAQSQYKEVHVRPATFPTTPADYAAIAASPIAYENPDGFYGHILAKVKADSYAAYGQMDWQFSDQWKFAVGGRYSRDEKEGFERRRTVIWNPSVVGAAAVAFDNSPTTDCLVLAGQKSTFNANYDKVLDRATGAEIVPPTSGTYTGICGTRTLEKRHWDAFTPSAIVEWKPMDDFLTYAKFARGYKSGAIRVANMDVAVETKPEHLNSFELGAKVTLAAKYQINLSAFYTDYKDYQFPVTRVFPDGSGGTVNVREFSNVGATSQGIELESVLAPIDPLTIRLSYSFLDTEINSDLFLTDTNDTQALEPDASSDVLIVSYQTGQNATTCPISTYLTQRASYQANPSLGTSSVCAASVAQNAKGSVLPNSPRHKVSAGVTYNFKFAAGSLIPSVQYSWRDQVASAGLAVSPLSNNRRSTPEYSNYDATITWMDADGRYRIVGNVSNFLNDETPNSVTATTFNGEPAQVYNLNPPRTWSLLFKYMFGSEKR